MAAKGFSLEPQEAAPAVSAPPPSLLAAAVAKRLKLKNPGGYDDAMMDAIRILPHREVFDGAKLEITKPLRTTEPIASVYQGLTLDTKGGVYTYGANWIGPGQQTVVMGKFDSDGALRANVIKVFQDVYIGKIQTKLAPVGGESVFNLDLDRRGEDNVIQFRAVNAGVFFFNYNQAVTPSLSVGTELIVPLTAPASVGVQAKYTDNAYSVCGKIDTDGGIHSTYMQKLTEQVSVATEFKYTPQNQTSEFRLGYELVTRSARMRAMVDNQGCVMGLVENFILPTVSLQISGVANYTKDSYKFGIGFTIGQ